MVHQSHRRHNNCSWFAAYILSCSDDALARTTFAQILVQAATVVAPKDEDALTMYRTYRVADFQSVAQTLEPASLMALMVKLIVDNLFIRTDDDDDDDDDDNNDDDDDGDDDDDDS